MISKKTIGNWGEKVAKQYLENKGYQILAANYYTRSGEIDLIGQKNNTLVFFEIKTKKSQLFGSPEETITPKKQLHLAQAAEKFLVEHPTDCAVRFDAISIQLIDKSRARINHWLDIIDYF